MNLDERQSIVVKASDIFSERCFAKIIGWIRMDQQSAEREAKAVGANIGDAQSGKEQTMSRYIDADALHDALKAKQKWVVRCGDKHNEGYTYDQVHFTIDDAPSIDIVRCKECKHRPVKEDANGENYGFNLIKPNNGDERCPCIVDDGWYSWMPKDDFFCGYGERKESRR